MNSEPFNQATIEAAQALDELANLPSREEVIKLLARERTRIAAVYDESGKRVHLDGRTAGSETGTAGGPIVCAICGAPAGEVQVEKVKVETDEIRAIAEAAGLPTSGYVCFGGDCALQRNKAIQRMFKPFLRPTRLTKTGYAMQWQEQDGRVTKVYAPTARHANRLKANRKQQRNSRRANRSN